MNIFFSFPKPGVRASFVGRPQRFLIEADLVDGSRIVAYCANPGSFRSCFRKGCPIVLWQSPDLSRKRSHTWRAIKLGRTWIGTDTHLANLVVEKMLREELLPTLQGFSVAAKEPAGSRGGRLDFLLTKKGSRCFLEVKSATVVEGRIAQFPDSISPRAIAHLLELKTRVSAGHRSIMIFLVQRGDVTAVKINRECDPKFTRAFDSARRAGVEFIGVKHAVSPLGLGPPISIPLID